VLETYLITVQQGYIYLSYFAPPTKYKVNSPSQEKSDTLQTDCNKITSKAISTDSTYFAKIYLMAYLIIFIPQSVHLSLSKYSPQYFVSNIYIRNKCFQFVQQ
jgi:hypothetical protein